MTASSPSIRVTDLTVDFGRVRALDSVTFEVSPGHFCLVTGENGAGKSTLLWALAGLLLPSAGRVSYPGASSPTIGFLSHLSFLYEDLTILENLMLTAQLHRLENPAARSREMLDRAGLSDLKHRRVSTLSRGQVQRTSFARAILPMPSVLLLDEPFAHLDSEGVEILGSLIESFRTEDKIVFVTSHDVDLTKRWPMQILRLHAGKQVS